MAEQKQRKKTRKKARKKQKSRGVLSKGFILSTLLIAVVTFYVCLSIGMNIYDELPF